MEEEKEELKEKSTRKRKNCPRTHEFMSIGFRLLGDLLEPRLEEVRPFGVEERLLICTRPQVGVGLRLPPQLRQPLQSGACRLALLLHLVLQPRARLLRSRQRRLEMRHLCTQ